MSASFICLFEFQTVTAKAGTSTTQVKNVGVYTNAFWAFNCGDSAAAFLPTDSPGVYIGISLHNTEVC